MVQGYYGWDLGWVDTCARRLSASMASKKSRATRCDRVALFSIESRISLPDQLSRERFGFILAVLCKLSREALLLGSTQDYNPVLPVPHL